MNKIVADLGTEAGSNCANQFAQIAKPERPKIHTVGECLDNRIVQARAEVERLCILKAKAEASGTLDYPSDFIRELIW